MDILFFVSNSPRWTSGKPRMLLVVVREFESRRGEILFFFCFFFCKKQKREKK